VAKSGVFAGLIALLDNFSKRGNLVLSTIGGEKGYGEQLSVGFRRY